MIVDDLDVFGPVWRPTETDAPLSVDSDAKLSPAAAFERLKLISWWRAQLIKAHRRIEHIELSRRFGRKSPPLSRADAIPEKLLGRPVSEAPDHAPTM